jgi:hypothetical protein
VMASVSTALPVASTRYCSTMLEKFSGDVFRGTDC